jgi:hypothetical protein
MTLEFAYLRDFPILRRVRRDYVRKTTDVLRRTSPIPGNGKPAEQALCEARGFV